MAGEGSYLPFYDVDGRYYIEGMLRFRYDDGGERVALEHCGLNMRVYYPSTTVNGKPFCASCIVCKRKYYARRATELWDLVEEKE